MRPGELVGRGADVRVGVVQHEVFDMHELALQPQRRRSIEEVLALDKTITQRAFLHALVEARQKILGTGERSDQGVQGQFVQHVGVRTRTVPSDTRPLSTKDSNRLVIMAFLCDS